MSDRLRGGHLVLLDSDEGWHWQIANKRLCPDSKVHGANMGSTCVLSAQGGSHVGPMNLAIRMILVETKEQALQNKCEWMGYISSQSNMPARKHALTYLALIYRMTVLWFLWCFGHKQYPFLVFCEKLLTILVRVLKEMYLTPCMVWIC